MIYGVFLHPRWLAGFLPTAVAPRYLAPQGLEDRVKLFTGHTRQLLPRFDQSFSAIFLDLWGSQYAEVLVPLVEGFGDERMFGKGKLQGNLLNRQFSGFERS